MCMFMVFLYSADIDYEHLCVELQGECSKERSSSKVVQRLMNKTFQKRRKWIIFDLPSVGTVLETFPPLRTSKYVSFTTVT